jgi:hypothetical protein
LIRVRNINGRPAVATRYHGMSGIQAKISPLLGVAMALDASIDQKRTNFLLEKLDRFGRQRRLLSRLHAKHHRFNDCHQQ